nr:fatty acid desaturase [Streptomyces sp. CoH17]
MRAADVDGGHFSDLAFGGLNHQIEHHLFTSMPSPDPRKARTIVRQYCRELGDDYAETGWSPRTG